MEVKFKLGPFARDKISSDLHKREFDHFGPFIGTAVSYQQIRILYRLYNTF
jgi:hypothetical protein